jgi:PAS domain S-box-containing protein
LLEKLAGLGESSVRKTYYPELQQRLEELERFKAFIDHSNDAIFLVEVPTSRIVDVNGSASRQTGWSREELLKTSLFAISDLASCPDAEKLISTPQEGRGEQTLAVTELFRKDDGRFPAELTLNRMRFRDQPYVIAVARDITERKQLEEQLLQSQKMEAIGQLAGGVAHDFNNILMVIMGYAHMLQTDLPRDDIHRDMVDKIVISSEKAAHLTRSLLSFSRKQVMKPRAADLNDIVQNIQEFLARIIGEEIQLKSVLSTVNLLVMVDSGQIDQVLINLATNARDAMPRGGTLTIETGLQVVDALFVQAHGSGRPGRYSTLSVSDTGIGMDEHTRMKIFEPFFTTKELGKGTGLGLAIVYGVVEQHDGFIHVYSEPQTGTTFRIYIPLIGNEPADAEDNTVSTPPRGGTETILVAEDEPAVRSLVSEILAGYGYRVILAEDGADAVAQFTANRDSVRLILMDMIMPKMRGREAYGEIRKIDPDVKVIYTSGYSMDLIQNQAEVGEEAELIMKPVQPFELLRKVRELLDR